MCNIIVFSRAAVNKKNYPVPVSHMMYAKEIQHMNFYLKTRPINQLIILPPSRKLIHWCESFLSSFRPQKKGFKWQIWPKGINQRQKKLPEYNTLFKLSFSNSFKYIKSLLLFLYFVKLSLIIIYMSCNKVACCDQGRTIGRKFKRMKKLLNSSRKSPKKSPII